MKESTEINRLDLRYEAYRLKNKKRERELLSSILEQGIREPLYVIQSPENRFIIVDGFKRYRCAKGLHLSPLPICVLSEDEAAGLLKFMRLCDNKGLSQIEQACLVDELRTRHHLSVPEIATRLDRSVSWVGMRLGILKEMSEPVKTRIMEGQFPFRNYLYTLKRFTRVGKTAKREIESFVGNVSGKGLSTRDIERLAQGYFQGGETLKAQISEGNLDWTLQQLKQREKDNVLLTLPELNAVEQKALSQLDWLYRSMSQCCRLVWDKRFENPSFFTKTHRMTQKLLRIKDDVIATLKEFYDSAGQKSGHHHSLSSGQAKKGHCQTA